MQLQIIVAIKMVEIALIQKEHVTVLTTRRHVETSQKSLCPAELNFPELSYLLIPIMNLRQSHYNSVIHVAEAHTIIFNALSGCFIIVRNKLLPKEWNLNSIQIEDSLLFSQMVKGGMIVEDEVDEIELVRTKIAESENNANQYILHINPTVDCNFRCWYCYENHKVDSRMSKDVLESIKAFIIHKVEEGIKVFHLDFFGGEPLLEFDNVVKPLILTTNSHCKNNGVKLSIHFTTNGSLLNDRIIEFLANYECTFQITLDGGRDTHNKTRFFKGGKGSYDLILENIQKLLSQKLFVQLRINYTSSNIDSVRDMNEFLSNISDSCKKYINIDFQRVWQDKKQVEDNTEKKAEGLREGLIQLGMQVVPSYLPDNVTNPCYGDKINHLLINYDGKVFGCTARDFNEDNSIGCLNQDGTVSYKETKILQRRAAKFSKKICHTCRIAPLCGGGCRQVAVDTLSYPGCSMGYSEEDIDKMILQIFRKNYLNQKTD